MESVEKQIALLLEKNDCVQVPDFGGFVLNRRSATFGTHSHELLSPGKAIGFNRNLQMNDGLLCSHISSSQKMLYTEAQALIAENVKHWKSTLSAGNVLNLENIGTIQQDSAQKWQFTPFAVKNFDINAYGLTSLQLKPVEQQTYTQKLDKKIKTKTKAMPQGRKVWLQRTVYSTIAAATLVLGFLVFDEIKYNSATNSLQQPIAQIEMSVVEKPAQSIATPQTIEPKTEPQQEQIQETVTETASYLASKFYVIGGAFSSVKNANIFAKQLEEKGYKAEVLHNEKGLTRVAYIVEADSLSADAQLQKIKQEENQAAWLLKW